MHPLLHSIDSPDDFRDWSVEQLDKLAEEIRDVLTNLVATRTAHYASNLGVVEVCLALHTVYDFRVHPQSLTNPREEGIAVGDVTSSRGGNKTHPVAVVVRDSLGEGATG